jgi:hypothetical protein
MWCTDLSDGNDQFVQCIEKWFLLHSRVDGVIKNIRYRILTP